MHATHIRDITETPGSEDQGMLLCMALKDLFFTRPLLVIAGDIADFPNTEKYRQTQRVT